MISANAKRPPKNLRLLGFLVLFVVFGAGAAALIFSISEWSAPGAAKRLKNPVPPTEQAIDSGMFNFMKHCQNCHGENGDGRGSRAAELSVKPTDFTNGREMLSVTDGELFWIVTHGHLPMPAFQDKLSEEERWELVDYLRTLTQPKAGQSPAAPSRIAGTSKSQ